MNQKLAVVCNNSVQPLAGCRDPHLVGLSGALSKGRVMERVVDLIRILREALVESQRPAACPFGFTDWVTWRAKRMI